MLDNCHFLFHITDIKFMYDIMLNNNYAIHKLVCSLGVCLLDKEPKKSRLSVHEPFPCAWVANAPKNGKLTPSVEFTQTHYHRVRVLWRSYTSGSPPPLLLLVLLFYHYCYHLPSSRCLTIQPHTHNRAGGVLLPEVLSKHKQYKTKLLLPM